MTDDWRRLHVGAAMARTAINALCVWLRAGSA
jgi:hypothetical protein